MVNEEQLGEEKEVTTPPEDVQNSLDGFIQHSATSNKSFVVRDRTGLRLSFAGLLPITTGDNGHTRIWAASIILNSAELEFPEVGYKLRATAKRGVNPMLTCNRSKGIIKQNDIFVLSYQLPETSIEGVQLTLVVDGSPHEVPLCKIRKADYYWIGKDTNVPNAQQFLQNRGIGGTPPTEPTPKNASPGRFEHLSDGLKTFLAGNNGLEAICKLLHPHATSLFRDLSLLKVESFTGIEELTSSDAIAEEIVRRFHEANRKNFVETPTLFNQQNS